MTARFFSVQTEKYDADSMVADMCMRHVQRLVELRMRQPSLLTASPRFLGTFEGTSSVAVILARDAGTVDLD